MLRVSTVHLRAPRAEWTEKTKELGPGAGCPRPREPAVRGGAWLPRVAPWPAFASFDGKFSQKTASSFMEVWVHRS